MTPKESNIKINNDELNKILHDIYSPSYTFDESFNVIPQDDEPDSLIPSLLKSEIPSYERVFSREWMGENWLDTNLNYNETQNMVICCLNNTIYWSNINLKGGNHIDNK